jgi:hypothetical protein
LVATSAELRRLVEQFKIDDGDNAPAKDAAATQDRALRARAGA